VQENLYAYSITGSRENKMDSNLKIDNIDALILKILLQDPRTSFAKIAKKIGMSIPSILNRFNSMKKSGIITGSIMQINPRSMGYNCVSLASINSDPKQYDEIHEFLRHQKIAIYGPHLTGSSSILGFTVTRDTDELSKIVKEIESHTGIRSVSTELWIKNLNVDHPENLIIEPNTNSRALINNLNEKNDKYITKNEEKKFTYNHNLIKNEGNKKLDDIDVSLIKILTNDARVSFRKLSKKLKISPNNVIKRYKKLRNSILPFSAITLNLKKIGYIGTGVLMIKTNDGLDVDEISDEILNIPNIIVLIRIFGSYDIIAITPFKNLKELGLLTKKIRNLLGVYEIDLMVDKPYEEWPLNMISKLIINEL
jgi:DNA-binding Lrp family transcriptional regulator